MCYDLEYGYERLIREAKKLKAPEQEVSELEEDLERIRKRDQDGPDHYYHLSGFQHPELGVILYKNRKLRLEPMTWGLIPHWVENKEQAHKLWNGTLNARSETAFEKPSYAAIQSGNKGILPVESFFEHHHRNKKTFPHRIKNAKGEGLKLAVVWDEWEDESGESLKTFAILTVEGNQKMAEIHNNPKMKGPRMPLMISDEMAVDWLTQPMNEEDFEKIYSWSAKANHDLEAYPVPSLRGKNAVGNQAAAIQPYFYQELNTLF